MPQFFATCPKLLEGLLEDELRQLGALQLKQTVAGVFFEGPVQIAYKACLWSRLANRILFVIGHFPVTSTEELYQHCYEIDWLEHMRGDSHTTLCVDFNGHTPFINNTQFGAQKVKDAIVDKIRAKTGERPSVDKINPDIRVNVYLHREQATVSIDLSGHSLHQRGYRLAAGAAPVKENVAAAVLLRANWPAIAAKNGLLLDPVCGSGTLLIEGALMAADIAPGLFCDSFGFKQWLGFDKTIWEFVWQEAQEKRVQGLTTLPEIHGYDMDPRVIGIAKDNIERAGLSEHIRVSVKELSRFTPPTHKEFTPGLIVANPPYGERLGEIEVLNDLYQEFGARLREHFVDWECAVLTANPELGKKMGLRVRKQHALFNGALPCKLLLFTVKPEWFYRELST